MDESNLQELAQLIDSQMFGALGTLRDRAPMVTAVLYAPADDLSGFYIHISRLAHHTQNIQHDSRVSLLIMQTAGPQTDPQTWARVSISGVATRIRPDEDAYESAAKRYRERNPYSERNFTLGDFELYRIEPQRARFVAGFGRI